MDPNRVYETKNHKKRVTRRDKIKSRGLAMKILLVGATGAIGRRLVPLLVGAGHTVTGTTRQADKAKSIYSSGATPLVVDARRIAERCAAGGT